MAKTKRLTNKQCEELNKILTPGLIHVIKNAFRYAYDYGFSPSETAAFIASFLTYYGKFDSIKELFVHVIDEMLTDDATIDFPNSSKNSENKSSDTKNTER